jgi:hypothetical protein
MNQIMTIEDAHQLAVYTGRVSAAAFVVALLMATRSQRAVVSWLAFLAAHTVHFFTVLQFARLNGGRDLFPGGTSFEEAGGWPTVLTSLAVFYGLAAIALAARHAGPAAGRYLRRAGLAATVAIAAMFLATYGPLAAQSALFALPSAVIVVALGLYLARTMAQARAGSP